MKNRVGGPPKKSRSRAIGRPPKTSREAIVDGVIALLNRNADPDVSIHQIAREIGVSSMAIYNYFKNRNALMEAVTARLMEDCRIEVDPGASWRERLTLWANVVRNHFRRHPYLINFLTWDEHHSLAWLAALGFIPDALARAGLSGQALGDASSWVLNAIMGQITFELWFFKRGPRAVSQEDLVQVPEPYRTRVVELREFTTAPDFFNRTFDFHLARIFDGLELFLREQAAAEAKTKAQP